MSSCRAFALGAQDAAFLRTGGLSISAASRGPDQVPFVVRALGSRVSTDLRRVTLFFSTADARELLDHIAANGKIAAIFSLPSTHESLQLKGSDAGEEPLAQDDLAIVDAYRRAFAGEIGKLGYPRYLSEAMLAADDIVAVSFTPSAAFSQTPGPRAGQALGVTP